MTHNDYLRPDEVGVWDSWCDLGEVIGKQLGVEPLNAKQDYLIKEYPDIRWAYGLGVRAGRYKDTV